MLRTIFSIGARSVATHLKSINAVKQYKVPCLYQLHQSVKFYCNKAENPIPTESQVVAQDPEEEKRLKVLLLEMEVFRQEGRRVPDLKAVKPDQWREILKLPTRTSRSKYYSFLWQVQQRKECQRLKKESRRLELEEKKAQENEQRDANGHIQYGLHRNTLFLRIYHRTMDLWMNKKLMNAMQFGTKLIVDCSYDQHMIPREAKNAAKQLMLLFADNRLDVDPFDLHFCNANFEGNCMKILNKYIPNMLDTTFPLNFHEESYLDLFPRKNLVYLTPHCRNDLKEFNPNDIYIIGAMVDKVNCEPFSLAKAKSEGLRMARLPLDQYLQWGTGTKSLTINQMLNIMLEIKRSGDWNKALSFVPRRKIVNLQEREEQKPMSFKVNKFQDYRINVDKWGTTNKKKKEFDSTSKQKYFAKKRNNL